jgi:Mrp family chromosome partitioning ATPase
MGMSNAVLSFSLTAVPNTPYSDQRFAVASAAQVPRIPTSASPSIEPFVHSVGIPNLWVMPSGPLPPNPSEFFESKVMQSFLSVIANCGIDAVIFDTAPLLGLSDTSILASKVDGALVVVDTTRATKGKLRQTKAELSQTGVHVLGCVANKLRYKRDDDTYQYYYRMEDQDSKEKSTRNGHMSTTPLTPLAELSQEQRTRSN